MAKQRYIDTKMWEDSWFSSLDQIEQLVFVYFLTNPMTNIIGAYELSKGTISRAVGLEILTLDEILKRFQEAKKVYYINGWVVLPNFIKHQNYKSPKIQKGIEVELQNVPDEVKELIKIPYVYGIDTLSHSNSNTNTNTNKIDFLVNKLKDWNERQGSPLTAFKPENIINKHGAEKIEKLLAFYGPKNNGFSQFLGALRQ